MAFWINIDNAHHFHTVLKILLLLPEILVFIICFNYFPSRNPFPPPILFIPTNGYFFLPGDCFCLYNYISPCLNFTRTSPHQPPAPPIGTREASDQDLSWISSTYIHLNSFHKNFMQFFCVPARKFRSRNAVFTKGLFPDSDMNFAGNILAFHINYP